MTKHIQWILKKHKKDVGGLKILVFLEKFHWLHVRFRLKNLSQKAVHKYYFGGFKKYPELQKALTERGEVHFE